MDLRNNRYNESPLVKTKIIATVGPACTTLDKLRDLVIAGVDLFRLNFAHGSHDWLDDIVRLIRETSTELNRPIGILSDLAGPKIRLGQLQNDILQCQVGAHFEFVRAPDPADPRKLTCTYDKMIDDLNVGDRMLLTDGIVAMRVVEKETDAGRVVCVVERPGVIRSGQGVNLPGVSLSTPSLTDKDREDLAWAIQQELDYVGMSFIRSASDIRLLREAIGRYENRRLPQIIAKIENQEAVTDLEAIIEHTDAVMVARGDLGVEIDIARVPILQKRIIRLCNRHRVPVITATQMLDSMERNKTPTRAEASDVANAVLDGSDAVMLSGETAIGAYPVEAVAMMSRILHEAECQIASKDIRETDGQARQRASLLTEATTVGAGSAAEYLQADLIVLATRTGKTALAVSKQRRPVPIVALSDRADTVRRMSLYWGVTAVETADVYESPEILLKFVVEWGKRKNVLQSGSRLVLVTSTNWSAKGHDLMLVHVVP